MLSEIGRSNESIADAKKLMEEEPKKIDNHIYLIFAYFQDKNYEAAYQKFQEAVVMFPDTSADLYCIGGDICRALHQYEEAFQCWDKAIKISDSYADARYSKAFCYQELKNYEKETDAWNEIIVWLKARGYIAELNMPKEYLRLAKEHLRVGKGTSFEKRI